MDERFFSLLFTDRKSFQEWEYGGGTKNGEYDAVRTVFNLGYIVGRVKSFCPDFPDEYMLRYPNDIRSAKYRRGIFADLLDNSALRGSIEDSIGILRELERSFVAYKEAKHSIQRHYTYVQFLAAYFVALDRFGAILADAVSPGLRALREMIAESATSDEAQTVRSAVEAVTPKLEKAFRVNAAFDFSAATIDVSAPPPDNSLATRISCQAKELLGAELPRIFSIISSNPFSALDEYVAAEVAAREPELVSELERINGLPLPIWGWFFFQLPTQLNFYIGYYKFMRDMAARGCVFSLPTYSPERKMDCQGMYDLSLSVRVIDTPGREAVSNSLTLDTVDGFILTGANQGGKTTFVRSIGITACLSQCGMPVPCASCTIPYFDRILIHFSKSEEAASRQGRLQDEITHFEEITTAATDSSLVLVNEPFAGTRRMDGVVISRKYFARLIERGCICGIVTHYYEMYDEMNGVYPGRLKSLVVLINESDSSNRLYKIAELPPKTVAYAHDIARACGVTLEQLLADTGTEVKE